LASFFDSSNLVPDSYVLLDRNDLQQPWNFAHELLQVY